MSFTYDGTPNTDLERVRLEIGDTDSTEALFQDEEINEKLSQRANNVLLTAADLCEILARKFARAYDFETDGQSFKRSQMSAAYAKAAKDLRARAQGAGVVDTTRVDGYSDDIPNAAVLATDTNPRRRYYGEEDEIPA
jgi:hypothetical protein